ncbi:hypothetical protein D6D08_10378, partial [Aureobasidium pullulans]
MDALSNSPDEFFDVTRVLAKFRRDLAPIADKLPLDAAHQVIDDITMLKVKLRKYDDDHDLLLRNIDMTSTALVDRYSSLSDPPWYSMLSDLYLQSFGIRTAQKRFQSDVAFALEDWSTDLGSLYDQLELLMVKFTQTFHDTKRLKLTTGNSYKETEGQKGYWMRVVNHPVTPNQVAHVDKLNSHVQLLELLHKSWPLLNATRDNVLTAQASIDAARIKFTIVLAFTIMALFALLLKITAARHELELQSEQEDEYRWPLDEGDESSGFDNTRELQRPRQSWRRTTSANSSHSHTQARQRSEPPIVSTAPAPSFKRKSADFRRTKDRLSTQGSSAWPLAVERLESSSSLGLEGWTLTMVVLASLVLIAWTIPFLRSVWRFAVIPYSIWIRLADSTTAQSTQLHRFNLPSYSTLCGIPVLSHIVDCNPNSEVHPTESLSDSIALLADDPGEWIRTCRLLETLSAQLSSYAETEDQIIDLTLHSPLQLFSSVH